MRDMKKDLHVAVRLVAKKIMSLQIGESQGYHEISEAEMFHKENERAHCFREAETGLSEQTILAPQNEQAQHAILARITHRKQENGDKKSIGFEKESGRCPQASSTIGTRSYARISSVIKRSLKNSPRGRLVLMIRTNVSVPIFAGNCS